MILGEYKNSRFFYKILQLIAATFFAIICMTVLTTLLTDSDLQNTNSVKQMQLIQSLFLFVLVPFLMAYLWSESPLHYLQLKTKTKFSNYILVAITMIVAIPFINLLTGLNKQLSLPDALSPLENWMKATEIQLETITLRILNVHTIQDLIVNLMLVAVLAGLGEELFFRGIIQKILGEKRNAFIAIWVAAFIFSTIHLQFYGFFPRLLLGAFFGYLLVWSNNLWLPILAHTLNNAIGVVFYYLSFNGVKVPNIDTIGTGDTIYLGVISAILTVFCIVKLQRDLRTNNNIVIS
ncbi:MAG: CPBP family intramembrane glutamic endopeptidase [Paludibacter sp.]